jgi:hypothetical protein
MKDKDEMSQNYNDEKLYAKREREREIHDSPKQPVFGW